MSITARPIRGNDWVMPDPLDLRLSNARWRVRYDREALTDAEYWLLLEAADAYVHFAAHPAGTEHIVRQLRDVRRAVRHRLATAAEKPDSTEHSK